MIGISRDGSSLLKKKTDPCLLFFLLSLSLSLSFFPFSISLVVFLPSLSFSLLVFLPSLYLSPCVFSSLYLSPCVFSSLYLSPCVFSSLYLSRCVSFFAGIGPSAVFERLILAGLTCETKEPALGNSPWF